MRVSGARVSALRHGPRAPGARWRAGGIGRWLGHHHVGRGIGSKRIPALRTNREEKDLHVLYRGLDRIFLDRRAGIKARNEIPAPSASTANAEIVEYKVAAANGNGESEMSRSAIPTLHRGAIGILGPARAFAALTAIPQILRHQAAHSRATIRSEEKYQVELKWNRLARSWAHHHLV